MGIKDHGYYGYAFVGARPLQFVSLVAVLGLVANFISLIARVKQKAPQELVATLVITCISVLWTLLSFTAYHDTHIPYIVTAVVDLLFLIPFIVIAVVLGQPLSYTTCSELPKHAKQNSYLAVPLTTKNNGAVSYVFFVGGEQTTCYEIMAVWGLMIALCVLFAISAIAAGFLFLGKRRATAAAAAEADFEMAPKAWSDSASFPPPPSESGSYVPPLYSRPATPAGGPRYDA
ncbi:hypothetical protein UCRPA7_8493 [Phaeoacremonium minimum UCRPA7]|uniref:MARVEL domain-containing protein n=1 Tax=Phaeoacremonium minimum (strain UCR-PA7) TaxID=1286976 RepID=R8B9I9_PHAM7|nr:hypothetical protein UCRPA7_8493 [Phaeoacremonium minimum UCRPA7]EON95974.1 hypothetical protein UCRPA7_8493 [Phaeoacremonium minimum UCRPA7]